MIKKKERKKRARRRSSTSHLSRRRSRGSRTWCTLRAAGPRLRNTPVMPRRLMSIDLVVARLRRREVQQLPFSVATLRACTSRRRRRRRLERERERETAGRSERIWVRARARRVSASFNGETHGRPFGPFVRPAPIFPVYPPGTRSPTLFRASKATSPLPPPLLLHFFLFRYGKDRALFVGAYFARWVSY